MNTNKKLKDACLAINVALEELKATAWINYNEALNEARITRDTAIKAIRSRDTASDAYETALSNYSAAIGASRAAYISWESACRDAYDYHRCVD